MSILWARLYARLNARLYPRLEARLRLLGRVLVPVGTLLAIAVAESAGRRWIP